MGLLSINNLRFRRGLGEQSFTVELPELEIERGGMLAITGESGSGKSTVLELLGLVAKPMPGAHFGLTNGDVTPTDIADLWRRNSQRALAHIRARSIGFVLQSGGLLPYLSVRDNILINRRLLGMHLEDPTLDDIIKRLEIGALLRKKPAQLSIGQQQRAAIGRALAHSPALLLADEPTSALDPRLADQVMDLLLDLVRRLGVTAVIATHEQARVRSLGLREVYAYPRDPKDGFGSVFLSGDGNKAGNGEETLEQQRSDNEGFGILP
jgi:putative ABC transport system ATP-binding protein